MGKFSDKWSLVSEDPGKTITVAMKDDPEKVTTLSIADGVNSKIYADLTSSSGEAEATPNEEASEGSGVGSGFLGGSAESLVGDISPAAEAAAMQTAGGTTPGVPSPDTSANATQEQLEAQASIVPQPGGAAAQATTPAGPGMITLSQEETRTQAHDTPKVYEDAQAEATDALQRNMLAATEQETAAMKADAAGKEFASQQMFAEAEAMQKRNDAYALKVQGRLDALDSKAAEVASMQVDPGRFYGEGITGTRVGALVSIALGAIGQAITGSKENQALNITHKYIDQDIAAQKANIAKARGDLSDQRGLLAEFMKVTDDVEAAEAMARSTYFKSLETQIAGKAAKSQIPVVKARGEVAVAELGQKAANEQAKAHARITTTTKMDKDVPLAAPKDEGDGKVDDNPLKMLGNGIKVMKRLDNIISMYEDPEILENLEVGPIEGRVSSWLMEKGWNIDPDTARLAVSQNLALALFVKSTSGAQVTDKERAWFQAMMAQPIDDPELALAKLKEFRRNTFEEHKLNYKVWSKGGRLNKGTEELFNPAQYANEEGITFTERSE